MKNAQVLLVRHGRTLLNDENRMRERLDPELDEVGRAEVGALAEALAAMEPARVGSSPLRRAVQTAQANHVGRSCHYRVGRPVGQRGRRI